MRSGGLNMMGMMLEIGEATKIPGLERMRAQYEEAVFTVAKKVFEEREAVKRHTASIVVKLALYRNCLIQ